MSSLCPCAQLARWAFRPPERHEAGCDCEVLFGYIAGWVARSAPRKRRRKRRADSSDSSDSSDPEVWDGSVCVHAPHCTRVTRCAHTALPCRVCCGDDLIDYWQLELASCTERLLTAMVHAGLVAAWEVVGPGVRARDDDMSEAVFRMPTRRDPCPFAVAPPDPMWRRPLQSVLQDRDP